MEYLFDFGDDFFLVHILLFWFSQGNVAVVMEVTLIIVENLVSSVGLVLSDLETDFIQGQLTNSLK